MATALDLLLDADGDLAIVDGDFAFATDLDGIAQMARLALSIELGEWFLDQSDGLDMYGSVLVKSPNLPLIRDLYRQRLLTVPGITDVIALDVRLFTDRHAEITFTAITDLGALGPVTVEAA